MNLIENTITVYMIYTTPEQKADRRKVDRHLVGIDRTDTRSKWQYTERIFAQNANNLLGNLTWRKQTCPNLTQLDLT